MKAADIRLYYAEWIPTQLTWHNKASRPLWTSPPSQEEVHPRCQYHPFLRILEQPLKLMRFV